MKGFQPSQKSQVWSSGGGVQSTAIAALICTRQLPKPDLAVIADTGREFSPVWRYLHETVIPALRKAGVELHVAPHDLATVDLYSGKEGDTLVVPVFTNRDGDQGKLPKYCSQEWKVRVVQRYCRQHGIADADQWIGFTTDEMERMRVYQEGRAWQHVYPLVDLRLRRSDCLALIERMGWPAPTGSACWMCPFRSDQEWKQMRELSPGDFERAVQFDRRMRERDSDIYLHRTMRPLDQIDFDEQPDLFSKPCSAGGCFT